MLCCVEIGVGLG